MTGYARLDGRAETEGTAGARNWCWELKSVNARGLDIRCRVPPGFERLEPMVRRRLAARLTRGSVQVGLTMTREAEGGALRVNRPLLEEVLRLHRELAAGGDVASAPPRLEALLAVRGVVDADSADRQADERVWQTLEPALLEGLDACLDRLLAMGRDEGARLAGPLAGFLDSLDRLVGEAGAIAAAQPAGLRDRLSRQLAELMDATPPVSEERLAQELALLASRADIREEVDRLAAHLAACRALLCEGGAVGRRLDFLCQELNREANTLCAKSADQRLTTVGLALKGSIEQFREQVQNIE